MVSGVNEFFSSLDGTSDFEDSERIDFMVYFLTVLSSYEVATVTLVTECFKACDLTPPSRVAPYLSEGLKSRPQKFVKVTGGYKLQRHYREMLSKRLGVGAGTANVAVQSGPFFTPDEEILLSTIQSLVPTASISYEQAIFDLRDDNRKSFRGPALELREALREVLDHIAPDAKVIESPNFRLENGRSRPTMKQKVRYILRTRKVGKTSAASPEDSVSAVDAIVGDLTRSVYDLGSLVTHVASERRQVMKVKRYIDAVLHDILDVEVVA